MSVCVASGVFELRCFTCSHRLLEVQEPMRLVAAFRPSVVKQKIEPIEGERRRRCRPCGWVNIFVPAESLTREPARN